jgi:hypothetical protein
VSMFEAAEIVGPFVWYLTNCPPSQVSNGIAIDDDQPFPVQSTKGAIRTRIIISVVFLKCVRHTVLALNSCAFEDRALAVNTGRDTL